MSKRLVATLPLLIAALATGASAQANPQPAGNVVRTASPAARGLTEADFPRVQRLAEGVYSYEALRSSGEERFTTVSLFVVTNQGVLVADGQGNAEETQRMVQKIGEITNQPITHVVICSDHGDHTGGNSAFPRTATFLAHPTSKALLERPSGRAGATAHPPIQAVPDRHVINLGGTEIQVLFLGRAHTGGDLSVYVPSQKVLFMSEAYLNRVFPAMRSAYPTEWVAAIEKAQAMDVDIYVPGHGFVESPRVLEEELETYRQALLQVIAEARRLHGAGRTADQAVEEARFGSLTEWTLSSSQAATAIRRVYAQLNGELPPAP